MVLMLSKGTEIFGMVQGMENKRVAVQAGKVMVIVLIAVLCPVSGAVADVYKYTDDDGIVHYTNVKPDGITDYSTFTFPCYASDPDCRGVNWEQVPLNTSAFGDEIRLAASRYSVDESLIRAVIHAESAYQPDAQSPKGAQGLMQLTPETQLELQVMDPFNPESNIGGGTGP